MVAGAPGGASLHGDGTPVHEPTDRDPTALGASDHAMPPGTRYMGPPDAPAAQAGANRWIALFAAACRRAVDDASRFRTVRYSGIGR